MFLSGCIRVARQLLAALAASTHLHDLLQDAGALRVVNQDFPQPGCEVDLNVCAT